MAGGATPVVTPEPSDEVTLDLDEVRVLLPQLGLDRRLITEQSAICVLALADGAERDGLLPGKKRLRDGDPAAHEKHPRQPAQTPAQLRENATHDLHRQAEEQGHDGEHADLHSGHEETPTRPGRELAQQTDKECRRDAGQCQQAHQAMQAASALLGRLSLASPDFFRWRE